MVGKRVPELMPALQQQYGGPNEVVFRAADGRPETFKQRRGGAQGDAMMVWVYCGATGRHVKKLVVDPKFQRCVLLEQVDDGMVMSRDGALGLELAQARHAVLLEEMGVAASKKVALCRDGFSPELRQELEKDGWECRTDGAVWAGCAIGSDEFRIVHVKKAVAEAIELMPLYAGYAASEASNCTRQNAYTLVSKALSTRLMHLARTLPPHITKGPLARFDAELARLWPQVTGVQEHLQQMPQASQARVLRQATLPIREGGLGLMRYVDILDTAHWGALAATWARRTQLVGKLLAGQQQQPGAAGAGAGANGPASDAQRRKDVFERLEAALPAGTMANFSEEKLREE